MCVLFSGLFRGLFATSAHRSPCTFFRKQPSAQTVTGNRCCVRVQESNTTWAFILQHMLFRNDRFSTFTSKCGDFERQLCCHSSNRHVFGDKSGDLLFSLGARRSSWLVHFLFQGLEFLPFVRLNTQTYEWSLGSLHEPITSRTVGFLATVGGA